jgi:curved DNA-binding protein CbpA
VYALAIIFSSPQEYVFAVFTRYPYPTFSGQGRMKDYYAALGIDSDASIGAIKTAYRKKASEFHPDKNMSPEAPARFREVQEAYDLLSDAGKRREYDENRQRSLLENPLASAEQIWTTYMHKVLQ